MRRLQEMTSSAAVGAGAIPQVMGMATPKFEMAWLEDPDGNEDKFRAWAEAVGLPGGSVSDILALVKQVYGGDR